MTETTDAVVNETEANETESKKNSKPARLVAPKTPEDVQAVTELKTTEASDSYSKFLHDYASHIPGFTPPSSEEVWAIIAFYRAWQSSPARKAELEAEKQARAIAAEKHAEEVARKREEREAAKALEEEAKARKAAEKAAKEAEDGEDLETVGEEGESTIPTRKKRRRPAPKTEEVAEDAVDEE